MIKEDIKPQVSSRGMLLGTCVGIADSSGVPTGIVRAATIVALCVWFKLALLAYCGLAIYYRYRR